MGRVLDQYKEPDRPCPDQERAWYRDQRRSAIREPANQRGESKSNDDRNHHELCVKVGHLVIVFQVGPHVARQVQDPERAEQNEVEPCGTTGEEQDRKELVLFADGVQKLVDVAKLATE